MAVSLLRRLAARAAVPVFACPGPGTLGATEALLRGPRLRRAASPREAVVLLVAGDIPARAAAGADRLHDQVPHPRARLRWDGTGDPEAAIVAAAQAVLDGAADAADRLPDRPPERWQGRGDHGQGGEGMTGGVPWGRPMATTGADIRDGLTLDAYSCTLGPFAPMLAPGLVLDLTLQGDVIADARVQAPPFTQDGAADAPAACAARLLRLLGLGAADAVARGGRPRGPGLGAAIPPGLGRAADGRDVRARLADWLAGRDRAGPLPDLAGALPGLEWHEATLVLNSWSPGVLRRACLAAAPA